MASQTSGSIFGENENDVPLLAGGAPSNRPKIGELLVEAGIVSERSLYQSLAMAQKSQQRIGKVLAAQNYATEQDIDAALLLQSLVVNEKLSRSVAVQVLKEAVRKQVPAIMLLNQVTAQRAPVDLDTNPFARFLADAQLLTPKQLAPLLKTSVEMDIELSRILVPLQLIDLFGADKALQALAQAMHGQLDYNIAISAAQRSHLTGSSVQEALFFMGAAPAKGENCILIGELLAKSGLATELEVVAAAEAALLKNQRIGEALIESGVIAPGTLENALEVQHLILKGVLERERAYNALHQMTAHNLTLKDFAHTSGLFHDNFIGAKEILGLLFETHIVNEQMVSEAYQSQSGYGMEAISALLASGRLPLESYKAARDVFYLLNEGRLTMDGAISALQTCHERGITLIDYLKVRDAERVERALQEDRASVMHIQQQAPPPPPEPEPSALGKLAKIISKSTSIFKKSTDATRPQQKREPGSDKSKVNRAGYSRKVLSDFKDRQF